MECSNNCCVFFFQAEDGIRDLVRSRGLGDVYKRQYQGLFDNTVLGKAPEVKALTQAGIEMKLDPVRLLYDCLLYTSDAADERSSVDLGGRRIIKKKKYI